ncbi:MAG: hypothetical protein OEX04_05865 [Acidimicrobiia bacterium]|nr:hypothetical protein [Acidimicrobiia bacterium]MDH4306986.1 hypothetical protein [Acidimicrobiia bacterium]MDH5294222.1 hypothetical protein [Acidimicrobiia bacterium]
MHRRVSFPVVAEGYAPSDVDRFIAELTRRARARISELEARVAELEANADTIEVLFDPAVIDMHEAGAEPVEDLPWAQSVIARSAYDGFTDDDRRRAAEALRSRRLSAVTSGK